MVTTAMAARERDLVTDAELDLFERLWREDVPAKHIAKEMGYSTKTILSVAYHNRERFPYRHKRVDKAKMDVWIERILAGRVSVRKACKELGVSHETVASRVRERRNAAKR